MTEEVVEDYSDKKTTLSYDSIIVYTDGGSRGNPGPSAAAIVIRSSSNELIYKASKYLGITTNNQAEYQAVKLALEKATELRAKTINFKMDSLLVVNQINGVYKIKNRELWPIYTAIRKLMERFQSVTFTHIRREFNAEADRLVNETLDEQA